MKDKVIKQLNILDQSLQKGWRMQRDTSYLWNTVLQANPALFFYTVVCIQVGQLKVARGYTLQAHTFVMLFLS